MSIHHDFGQLRKAAADLAYIQDHGLLADLLEWLRTKSPGSYAPDRAWRIEHGTPGIIASLLEDLTGADGDICLSASVAELAPDGRENRPALISQFANLHRRHGSSFYALLYEHLGDGGKPTMEKSPPLSTDKRRERQPAIGAPRVLIRKPARVTR